MKPTTMQKIWDDFLFSKFGLTGDIKDEVVEKVVEKVLKNLEKKLKTHGDRPLENLRLYPR